MLTKAHTTTPPRDYNMFSISEYVCVCGKPCFRSSQEGTLCSWTRIWLNINPSKKNISTSMIYISNSIKPVVRPSVCLSVCLSVCSSVRQSHFWAQFYLLIWFQFRQMTDKISYFMTWTFWPRKTRLSLNANMLASGSLTI